MAEKRSCVPARAGISAFGIRRKSKWSTAHKLGRWRSGYAVFLFCAATAIIPSAQTFTTLASFAYPNGARPEFMSLVQGRDGNFYGTTALGGANGPYGTIFGITPKGTMTTLHNFDGTDGQDATAGLVLATDGNLYGTTAQGGAVGYAGTIFKITLDGTLTTLHSFCAQTNCSDGEQPDAALVQGRDGNFYGTTQVGGAYDTGTVFKITAKGKLTTLHSFCAAPDCTQPTAALVQATNGNFYGTTGGTVFRITPAGKLTTLYTFGDDEATDYAGLVQATDGNFYGTTYVGRTYYDGTVYKITPAGVLTTLHAFKGTDGNSPQASLVQATNGNLYGTTYLGGAKNAGTIFKITLDGTLTTLHSFCAQTNCTDGSGPTGTLLEATNGNLYGTTQLGGTDGEGVVFSLKVGLKPFVKTQTTSGKEGAKIGILGQGFSSSSVVKFGGTQATTIALTGTAFISATVPAEALTGPVTVTTGTTTLTSPQTFKVLPTITNIPSSGSVGTLVAIDGTELTQTTTVKFGGVKATSFTVNSDTQVTAEVPTGAKTGKIAVTTQGGSATSKTTFTVN
jgi:uncharacterized repeat protein (TIGR03803 family)